MSRREEHPAQRSRLAVLPSVSSRTLLHPSFLPLYMTAHFGRHHRHWTNQAAQPIIPAEFFYSDPTMGRGTRIPNAVTDLRVLEFFQLNTPPSVMSTGLATSNSPDPFRFGPHPTRDLGSTSWSVPPHHRPVHPRRVIIQLSQEEDQAITTLLKLHHQSPLVGPESFGAAKLDVSCAGGPPPGFNSRLFHHTSVDKHLHSDVHQRRAWSDSELEAANTLVSHFIPSQDDKIWDQNDHKSVETHLGFLAHQHSSSGTEPRHGSEAPPASVPGPPTQNKLGFCCLGQKEEASWQDVVSAEDGLASGGFAEAKRRTLSDSEGNAVRVLLSLGETVPAEPVQ